MRQHVVPSLVASLVACAAAVGFVHVTRAPQVTNVVAAPAGALSPAKANRIARTTWPQLEQREIDELSAALVKLGPPSKVTIFCVDDAKCSDLALSLENAFETAHWEVAVVNSPMIPPGAISSSSALVQLLSAWTRLEVKLDTVNKNSGPGDYIALGERPAQVLQFNLR